MATQAACGRKFSARFVSARVHPHVGSTTVRLFILFLFLVYGFGSTLASVVVTHPYQGVTFIARSETTPRNVNMHVVVIDLRMPGIRFKLTPPSGTRDTVRQTTLDFLNEQHAQVAINCHFMLPFPSTDTNVNLVGLAASNGEVYSPFEPQPIAPGYVDQSYAILPFAPALNISRHRHARIVHVDPAYPDHLHILEDVKLWNAIAGSAQIVSNGVKTIPSYSGSPNGLNALNGYSDLNSWYDRIRARVAIGLTTNRKKLVLFTVDETGGSAGMTVSEVADVLINDYKVHDALNLDGGGSTSMALRDPATHVGRLVNAPSDNPLGRAVGSNLGVFALPMPSLTTTVVGNHIVLSWPAPSKGWHVQENPNPGSTNWENVSAIPERGSNFMQIILAPQSPAMFYRLSR